MEKLFNKICKILLISFTLLIVISCTNKIFAACYTSNLNVGDKLKFVGTSWYIYKTEEAAKKLDTNNANGYLKNGNQITIAKISGNVLKIGNNKFIYYGSTAKQNFKKISSGTGAETTFEVSIGSKQYKTLQEAINTIPKNNTKTTVKLLKDVSYSESVKIEQKQNVVLDLNGHTIKGTGTKNNTIYNKGILKLNGNGKISGNADNYSTIYNCKGASLTIEGGTITAKDTNAIVNYGTLKISGNAKISTESVNQAIGNAQGASLTIEGGTITSKNSEAIYNKGTLKISGDAKISNESVDYPTIFNKQGASLTIEGGTITAKNTNAIYNEQKGVLSITGGTITSKNTNAIKNYGTINIGKNAIIINKSNNSTSNSGASNIITLKNIILKKIHKIKISK